MEKVLQKRALQLYAEGEKLVDIADADVFYDFPEIFFRREVFAFLHKLTEIIAEHAAVKLVTGIADKAAAVRQHADGEGNGIEIEVKEGVLKIE